MCTAIAPSVPLPTNQSSSILTNQDTVFWINERIWNSHLHKDRPINDWGNDFCLLVTSLLAGGAHFFFPTKTEDCISLAEDKTPKMYHLDQSREEKAEERKTE